MKLVELLICLSNSTKISSTFIQWFDADHGSKNPGMEPVVQHRKNIFTCSKLKAKKVRTVITNL